MPLEIAEPISPDFIHIFQDRKFLMGAFLSNYSTIVGNEGNIGVRYSYGPFSIEYYTGDNEPKVLPVRGFRLIIWRRVLNDSVPHGWNYVPRKRNRILSAYVDIRNKETYRNGWSRGFKYYDNLVMRSKEYRVEEIPPHAYCELYKKYISRTMSDELVSKNLETHKRHLQFSLDRFKCLVLVDNNTSEVVGGIGVIDCKDIKQSYYFSSFTRKDLAPQYTGFWLCSNWMERVQKEGYFFANLGVIWTQGQPRTWKGFGDFKMKFRPTIIDLKKELYKITWGF